MPRYVEADTPLYTWYFVERDEDTITPVKVVRSTDHDTVIVPHYDTKTNRTVERAKFNGNRFFPTYEQARSFVVARCTNELERRRSALQLAEMFLDRANALPMEAPDADGK